MCLLVIIGVRADGRKELVALADGFRESAESWADLLRDAKRRGMTAPVLAVGDGALGFWKAVRDVFPETAEQRCWWHKIGNVLAALPEVGPPGGEAGAGRDLQRRGQDPRPRRREGVRRRVRRQVAEGDREDHRRPRRAARVLRLPGRALDPPADHQPDRVDLRHRPAPAAGHQRPRQPRRRRRDGVQADRSQPRPGGGWSTHPTSSPWSAPAPSSSTANSSNDPTTKINKEVISKRREDTPIHRS